MKNIVLISILLVSVTSPLVAQTDEGRKKNFNVKKNIALDGYDPVSYFDRHPAEGKEDLSWSFKGIMYRFVNTANLTRFRAAPEKYEPAYGGWCAYAMGATGEKVKVDPGTYKIVNGKLYLFYNFWGNNTLTDWDKNEKRLMGEADSNWKKFTP